MIVTCRQLTEMITDQKEGKLSSLQRAGYALHLAWCRGCRAYVEQMNWTLAAMKELPDEPVPDEARADVIAQFRQLRNRGSA